MALNPLWLQNLDYSAQLDRQLIEALVATEGVTSPLSLKVTPKSPASMIVEIAVGSAFVKGDDSAQQGIYLVKNTSAVDLSFAGTLPAGGYKRIDSVCLAVRDPDASGPSGDNAAIVRVAGTAVLNAAVASPPTLPDTHLRLADVEITSTTTSISSANIYDRRALCGGLDHVGTIQQWAGDGTLLPNGWLLCNGATVSRTAYPELFALIGTTYGAGDGSTFGLPDLRGRAPIGVGTGTYAAPVTARVLGAVGGLQSVTLSTDQIPSHQHHINHNHGTIGTTTNGDHTHGIPSVGGTGAGTNTFALGLLAISGVGYNTLNAGNHSHSVPIPNFTGNGGLTGGGGAHENMPPFITLNFIIRAA